ncbi:hypothetical protein HMPREF1989_01222 [Porphyromonas gingivalis F0566]|nr:hypothetical protein HMPREF1989_01222 [Porphyromonas gingivalis F0566]
MCCVLKKLTVGGVRQTKKNVKTSQQFGERLRILEEYLTSDAK